MDPLIALLLGVFVGSLLSGCLVWLATRPDRDQSPSEPLRILRGMVGKGILPSHVWEQVSKQMRIERQSEPEEWKALPGHSKGIGYHVQENSPQEVPTNWDMGRRLVLALWCISGLPIIAQIKSISLILALAAALLSGAVWVLARYPAWLNRFGIRIAWFGTGVAGWTLASLASQGAEVDPQKLIFAGLAGICSGLGAMVALNASIRRTTPSLVSVLGQAVLLFGPIFLLTGEFGKWDSDSRDWAHVLPANWLPFTGAAWALSLAARTGFTATGLVTALSFFGCWIAGWLAIQFSASGQGRGLPAFALGAFFATAFSAVLTRLIAKPEARELGKIPTGPLSFMATLFLAGFATTVWTAKNGYSPALAGGLFLAGSVSAWVALACQRRNLWGLASLCCFLGSIGFFSIYMHNNVPVTAWWPFMSKFLGLGLSLGSLGWCLAQWRFPSRKSLPFVCVTSLAGVIGWLLPTQALVLATLVEPTWMSEVIRAPIAGWWNLPLAAFSVGMAWWMHRSLPGMRLEIWLSQFVLVCAGLATAWATLGLDTEESPKGVLAVLASWSLGALALGLFRSRWSAIFTTIFLGFAWFLAWSQAGRLPAASHLWSLAPACCAWLMGSFHSLRHGKRWILLGSTGSIMVGLSAWSGFETVQFGPGLLVGALLIALNLMALEVRHTRNWLAPQNLRKALRLREPSFWLGVCQALILVGSFLTVSESGHGGWLTLALVAQSVVLWLVRGSQSTTLAQLQSIGAAMAGGLFLLGVGETLDAQSWFPRFLEAVPPLAFFVPGALAGVGVQQMASSLGSRTSRRGAQVALAVLAAPGLFNLVLSVFPSSAMSQWIMALISACLWPALAWTAGNRVAHSARLGARHLYQIALGSTILPITMLALSLGGMEGLGLHQLSMASLLACVVTAGWCLIAPQVDLSWSLQAHQAFAASGRRLLALALLPLMALVGFAQSKSDFNFTGGHCLALIGITLACLIATLLANSQRSAKKAARLQAFSLAFLFLGWIWACGTFQFPPPISRSSMVLLGSFCVLLSTSGKILASGWKSILQMGGSLLQLAVMACMGLSLLYGTSQTGMLANWGIDAFTPDWKPWVLEISTLSMLVGITGWFVAVGNWHASVKWAFLAWAAAGWVGLAIATQGANVSGLLLATAGLISGIYMANRQTGGFQVARDPILNRDAA